MELQVVLPDEQPTMNTEELVGLAMRAEELGYTTAWLPDHVLPPGPFGTTYGGVLEPLVTLSYLAAQTSTIRLGTSVLVLPMRSPFVVAKQAATLHRLSAERLTLGVGIGWDRAEFAAVGVEFANRAARTDDALALLRALFTGDRSYRGARHGFEVGYFEPVPRAPVPIMVGGNSSAALRRAARFADEWQAVEMPIDRFAGAVTRLRELAERPVRATVRIRCSRDADLAASVAAARAYADTGADAVALWFSPLDGFGQRMARFAGDVVSG